MFKPIYTSIRILLISLATFSLFACGGGGSSSTGTSSSSPFTSSLVVEVNDPARFTLNGSEQHSSLTLAALLAEVMISNAYAQTAGIPIYIDGELSATTDSSGTAVIPVYPGVYTVCIGDDPQHCIGDVSVEPDSVVVVDGDNLTTSVERAQDHIVAFQDPGQAHKTLVCHKGQTISVGTPAAQKGHHGHGDSLGACKGDTYVAKAEKEDEEDKDAEEDEDEEADKADKSKGKSNKG